MYFDGDREHHPAQLRLFFLYSAVMFLGACSDDVGRPRPRAMWSPQPLPIYAIGPQKAPITTIEEMLTTNLIEQAARRCAAEALSQPNPETSHCMTCGRPIDAEKAKLGGRARFCSDRCMAAFDAGWPVYGTTPADYVRVVEHRKLKVAPKTTRKPRKRVLRPQRVPSVYSAS